MPKHLPVDQEWAKALAYHCVRNNTSLETLHADGKISDDEMRTLMKEVVNNLFFMLHHMKTEQVMAPLLLRAVNSTAKWDAPAREGSLWEWFHAQLMRAAGLKT